MQSDEKRVAIPGIEWFHDAFDDGDKLIEHLNSQTWLKPQDVRHEDRSNSVIYLFDRTKHEIVFSLVDKIKNAHVKQYEQKYFIPSLTYSSVEGLMYAPGERYVAHHDNGAKHVSNRVCSMVVYLNDDYAGGEIEFVLFGEKTKPPKCSVVVFPSNHPYLHTVHPVISGVRYALNVFFSYE